MIDIHIPTSLEYNTANANLLAIAIQNLSSIDEIAEWNEKAIAEVKQMSSILETIEEKQKTVTQIISEEQQEYKEKTFFSRIFTGRKEQKHWLLLEWKIFQQLQISFRHAVLSSAVYNLPTDLLLCLVKQA